MKCTTYKTPGGVSFIACGPAPRKRKCKTCGAPADKLCDEPLTGGKVGKTCDAPMCDRCATNVGPDRDLCPPHVKVNAERMINRLRADAWLQDLIASEAAQDAVQRARQTSAMPVSDKVRHVRNAVQTRGHECHWPGCRVQVKPALWGCTRHWYQLPQTLRDKIWRAYRPGQEDTLTPSRTYVEVAREVQDWIESYEARQRRAMTPASPALSDALTTIGRVFGEPDDRDPALEDC